jgi:hypothetical protein
LFFLPLTLESRNKEGISSFSGLNASCDSMFNLKWLMNYLHATIFFVYFDLLRRNFFSISLDSMLNKLQFSYMSVKEDLVCRICCLDSSSWFTLDNNTCCYYFFLDVIEFNEMTESNIPIPRLLERLL